jgi:hypothetical protein
MHARVVFDSPFFPPRSQVWHNYSFDRAMMWRHGIDVKGFGGDTIHMYAALNPAFVCVCVCVCEYYSPNTRTDARTRHN